MEQQTGSKLGKEYVKIVYCHPAYLPSNYKVICNVFITNSFHMMYSKYIMWNAGLDESQAGIKIVRRNINNLRYADHTTLMAENKEELKSLLMRVEKKREKAGLKLNIKNTKIMASSPITSWQIVGEKVETVKDRA